MDKEKLLNKLKGKCSRQLVTVDMLLEGKSFDSSERLINTIQELIKDKKLYTMLCCNNGRFETRLLVTGEEVIEFAPNQKKVRKTSKSNHKKTKRIISKTKRSLLQ